MPISSRPHKRVLLMQPTAPPAATGYVREPAPAAPAVTQPLALTPIPSDPYAVAGETGRPVRVVAYLSAEESELLDQLWLKMRGYGVRPSKADIMRVALMHATKFPEEISELVKESDGASPSAAALTARTAAATAARRR